MLNYFYSKKGHDTVRSRGLLLPQFPLKVSVEAGMFMHDKVYLFDSSPNQRVWGFKYNRTKHVYDIKAHSVISADAFLQVCGIRKNPKHKHFRIKAIAQLAHDPTCILFDE